MQDHNPELPPKTNLGSSQHSDHIQLPLPVAPKRGIRKTTFETFQRASQRLRKSFKKNRPNQSADYFLATSTKTDDIKLTAVNEQQRDQLPQTTNIDTDAFEEPCLEYDEPC